MKNRDSFPVRAFLVLVYINFLAMLAGIGEAFLTSHHERGLIMTATFFGAAAVCLTISEVLRLLGRILNHLESQRPA